MRNKITILTLKEMKQHGEKIAALTCYNAQDAGIIDEAGIEIALIGDSVANVRLGYENTLPVTMDEMLHHTRAAKRGLRTAMLVSDMPYLSYELSPIEAAHNAGRFVKEAGAEAVKLEGGYKVTGSIKAILTANIPVMGHLGLTPQSIHRFGGYHVQGTNSEGADQLLEEALLLEATGVFAIVLEAIPVDLAKKITERLKVPTIGIGAGPHCDGQILVLDDMLGLSPGKVPKFVKKYADLRPRALDAARTYIKEVKSGQYPDSEHSY